VESVYSAVCTESLSKADHVPSLKGCLALRSVWPRSVCTAGHEINSVKIQVANRYPGGYELRLWRGSAVGDARCTK
jgi:hypothetical protein